MEIDFMGLYSQNPAPGPVQNSYELDEFVDSGIGNGEGNVSLSLCTSSPMEEKAVFRDFPRKKIGKSPAENMTMLRNSACNYDRENAQPRERSCQSFVGKQVIGHSGFLYNREDGLSISRNKFERPLSFPASSTIFCPTDAPIFFHAQKADRKIYAIGDASSDDTRKSKGGYTPTVAMARKATLARFLEKRSHRLNQQIKPHLMGRSLNWPEACDTTFTKCNKKIKTSMQHEVLM
ncbi:uncharacterized protein LOC142539762 isoform X1 [Primulina tabacum]|uniref:uncharacterized protein LOC142539762 isoform X1 n=1 Tax=Primulina tabacum TaxID=48773 RepID=UPI003F5A0633